MVLSLILEGPSDHLISLLALWAICSFFEEPLEEREREGKRRVPEEGQSERSWFICEKVSKEVVESPAFLIFSI